MRKPRGGPNGRPPLLIEAGQKFVRLTAIKRIGSSPSGNIQWLFRCKCGNETVATVSDVKRGFKKSCGCMLRERAIEMGRASATHKMFGSPEYTAWADMWQRCTNPDKASYKYYGARGIKVCIRWRKFENFFADMGFRPAKGFSLDRRNNDGGYKPSNCQWATRSQQNKNKRRRHAA